MQKDEMREHLVNDCPFFVLECNECSYEYKRCDFHDVEKHDCIKNLLEQVAECNKKIVELKAQSEEEAKANLERRKRIDELEAKLKQLNEKYNKACVERQKLESKNYDFFISRHTYQNHSRMPLKLPKNFVNTVENSKDGKLLDGPIFVDLARKKKGASWTTSVTVELVFKRKLAFNAYSLQFWQGEPKKVEEEKVEEEPVKKDEENKEQEKPEEPAAEQEPEVEEHRPGNRAYMYIYVFNMADGKSQQIGYQHFNTAPKEEKPVKDHVVKWRDCGAVITDRVNLRFDLYNDKDREQFEKLLISDFNFHY